MFFSARARHCRAIALKFFSAARSPSQLALSQLGTDTRDRCAAARMGTSKKQKGHGAGRHRNACSRRPSHRSQGAPATGRFRNLLVHDSVDSRRSCTPCFKRAWQHRHAGAGCLRPGSCCMGRPARRRPRWASSDCGPRCTEREARQNGKAIEGISCSSPPRLHVISSLSLPHAIHIVKCACVRASVLSFVSPRVLLSSFWCARGPSPFTRHTGRLCVRMR